MRRKQRKVKRLAVAGSQTQETSGLSHQCSATEPCQPDNHQLENCKGWCQWQRIGGSSKRCPGFDSWKLLAFSLSSINI